MADEDQASRGRGIGSGKRICNSLGEYLQLCQESGIFSMKNLASCNFILNILFYHISPPTLIFPLTAYAENIIIVIYSY